MNTICRICIQQITGNVVGGASRKNKLMYCVPKIDLRILRQATICEACFEALNALNQFKIRCRDVEDKVNNYFKENGIVNLKDLLQFSAPTFENIEAKGLTIKQELNLNDNVEMVCRTCLRHIPNHFSSSSNNVSFDKHKLTFCVPEMNLWTVPDIKLCEHCSLTLDAAYEFLKQCQEVEKTIDDYLKVRTSIDREDFLEWFDLVVIKSRMSDTKTGLQDVTVKNEKIELIDGDVKVNINFDDYLDQTASTEFNANGKTSGKIKFCECAENTASYRTCEYNTDILNKSEDMSKGMYKCSQCKYNTDKELCLRIHFQMHASRSFACPQCEHCGSYVPTLKKHSGTHIEKRFECLECDYKTKHKSDLKKHIQKHSTVKPFKCLQCEYSTRHKKCLEKHVVRLHSDEKLIKCVQCDYSTTAMQFLKHHFKTSHPDEKLYKCPICSFSTVNRSNLKNHIRIHIGVKPHECPYCSYAAIQKSILDRHMKKHTGEKPFKCSHCNFSTTYSSNLRCHLTMHTGEKPHKCSLCDFTSGQRSIMRRHISVHSSDKQFKCSQCWFITKREMYLKRHVKMHGDENRCENSHSDAR